MTPASRSPLSAAQSLGDASVAFDGEVLSAGAGGLLRRWRWTGSGLATCAIESGGEAWLPGRTAGPGCDWRLPICEDACPPAELRSVEAFVGDDEGFTAPHAGIRLELEHPAERLALRCEIWAYPGAGLRQRLSLRALDGFAWEERHRREVSPLSAATARLARGSQPLDRLPIDPSRLRRRLIGYHSDTQHRNDAQLDLLLEAVEGHPLRHPRACHWASIACLEDGERGLALVKESHRCVNTPGHDCGEFILLPGEGLLCTGWGLLPQELDGAWRPAWAGWLLAWQGGERARQEAFKRFDRSRYPLRPAQLRLQANTWGSSQGFLESRAAAAEDKVLDELAACADLGVEVLQIDDGWQGDTYDNWDPERGRYRQGWAALRRRAQELRVGLGLWMSVNDLGRSGPSLAQMQRAADEGGMTSFKFDFARLNDRRTIDDLMARARALISSRGHRLHVDWDLTEVIPRYGYFFAREYGRVHFANRKPALPRNALYRPGVMLRDLWQLAHYVSLQKFQGTIQDPAAVDPLRSDAAAYSLEYCVAIALMSSPLFFCEVRRFDAAGRARIRPLLAAWRGVREQLANGIVHPLGARPDGRSWTGFENVQPEGGGFLLVFREPDCPEPEGLLALPHLAGQRLRLEDLLTSAVHETAVGADGGLTLQLASAGSFRFLRYAVQP